MGAEDEDEVFHDEVEIEDFIYDDETDCFTYPCPCGDLFSVSKEDLLNGEDVARCPSCSLVIKVIYNPDEIESVVKLKTGIKNSKTLDVTKPILEKN